MFFGNIVIFVSLATLLGASYAAIESELSEHELEPQEVEKLVVENLGSEAMITEVDAELVAQSKREKRSTVCIFFLVHCGDSIICNLKQKILSVFC